MSRRTTQEGRAMTGTVVLFGPGFSSRLASSKRARLAAGLALAALLPGAHGAAVAQESTTARIARENLPAVVTLIAVDDHDQPLALGSGFFITRDGIVGGLRTLGSVKFLQVTAPISPGSSGGPVFNSVGRVIGIATATSARGQNLNFALPVNLLRDLPPATVAFRAATPAAFDLREGDRLKDLVYFNNIIEEFGVFAEGSTLASLTASLQNRTAETIADVRILVVVKNPRGEVLDFHLRDFKGTVILPGLAKQVSIPILTRGLG